MNDDPSQQSSPQPTGQTVSLAEAVSIVATLSAEILSAGNGTGQPLELSQALGFVLALPIVANRDQPPFPRVTRDGFAVRAQDVAAGAALRVVGELRAGEPWRSERAALASGEAIEIMTGAALPPGADAVLMVEHVEAISASPKKTMSTEGWHGHSIRPSFGRTCCPGENVVPQGSEARKGDVLLDAGTRLHPEEIALAASCGLRSVPVYSQPPVAILATGDELVEPDSILGSESGIELHQIYDSNSYSLAALVRQAHGIPLRQLATRDQKNELTKSIRGALKVAPLLLLSGGVSMGRYDLVEEVLTSLGAEFFFTGVRMQPGKPAVFGRVPSHNGSPARFFFGLPGNPVSTMVTFRVLVEPMIAALSGERHWQPRTALAILTAEVRAKSGLTRFLPARLDTTQSEPLVTPIQNQGSGDLSANARANCYVIVPDDKDVLAAGQTIRVLLRWWS